MENVKYKSPGDMPRISGGMGYSTCSVCGCAEFKGSGNICERCGHSFSEHW